MVYPTKKYNDPLPLTSLMNNIFQATKAEYHSCVSPYQHLGLSCLR